MAACLSLLSSICLPGLRTPVQLLAAFVSRTVVLGVVLRSEEMSGTDLFVLVVTALVF